MKLLNFFLSFCIVLAFAGPAAAQAPVVEKKTIDFESLAGHIKCDLFQPDFLYGDCAYTGLISASDGKIYFFVSSHNSDYAARFYSFDPATDKITFIASMDKVLGEDAKEQISHGKVHTQIFEHKNKLWFATHISHYKKGLPSTDYRGKKPYSGGHFVSYDLKTGRFDDLARIFPNEGIITMEMDKDGEILYGLTWTTGILVSYDIKNNDLRYWGAVQKMGEWGHRGGTEWDMICRTLAIDPNGFVYGSTMDGAIWKYYASQSRRVSFIEGLDLSRVPFSQSAEGSTKGDFKDGWRTIDWNPNTNSFWGLHFHCTTLFEFDPAANYIRAVDELRPLAYRGMPTNPETSQLGFMVGPKNTIFYLADGPMVKIAGRPRLRCNLYLITYDIDKQKYTDHGPILSSDKRRVFFGESIAIGADDHIYSVAWVEVTDEKRIETLRSARTRGAPAETARAVYEMLLVRLPKWQEFVK
jgi:hypothetical protein